MTNSECEDWVRSAKRIDAQMSGRVDTDIDEKLLRLDPNLGPMLRELKARQGSQEGPFKLDRLIEEFRNTPRSAVVSQQLLEWTQVLLWRRLPRYKEWRERSGRALSSEEWLDVLVGAGQIQERMERHVNALLVIADEKAGYETDVGRVLAEGK